MLGPQSSENTRNNLYASNLQNLSIIGHFQGASDGFDFLLNGK